MDRRVVVRERLLGFRIWSVETNEELVRLFFRRGGEAYAGVNLENQTFGDATKGTGPLDGLIL